MIAFVYLVWTYFGYKYLYDQVYNLVNLLKKLLDECEVESDADATRISILE